MSSTCCFENVNLENIIIYNSEVYFNNKNIQKKKFTDFIQSSKSSKNNHHENLTMIENNNKYLSMERIKFIKCSSFEIFLRNSFIKFGEIILHQTKITDIEKFVDYILKGNMNIEDNILNNFVSKINIEGEETETIYEFVKQIYKKLNSNSIKKLQNNMYINLCNHTLDLKRKIKVGFENIIPHFSIENSGQNNEQNNDQQGQSITLLKKSNFNQPRQTNSLLDKIKTFEDICIELSKKNIIIYVDHNINFINYIIENLKKNKIK